MLNKALNTSGATNLEEAIAWHVFGKFLLTLNRVNIAFPSISNKKATLTYRWQGLIFRIPPAIEALAAIVLLFPFLSLRVHLLYERAIRASQRSADTT
jgi:ABC-type spermidine/putrescine transport system permease subunit II